jgi:2-C-methyl-D-erythritol 4-phosphate cytidylyltransferase
VREASTVSVWAIVVAAGSGSRFGSDVPKQFLALGDRRVLDWSLETAAAACDGVVLVVASERAGDPEPGVDVVVAGGATRSESVRAGLAALPADCEIVVIHDGARPLASEALYHEVVVAVRTGADGAVPGLPVPDTIKRVIDDEVQETLVREELVAVQTPQAFLASALRAAHAEQGEATDDAALIEQRGGRVVVVPGEPDNRKVTRPADLVDLARILVAP